MRSFRRAGLGLGLATLLGGSLSTTARAGIAPTAITFAINHADCGGAGTHTFDLFLNDVRLATVPSSQDCVCNTEPLVVSFTDAATTSGSKWGVEAAAWCSRSCGSPCRRRAHRRPPACSTAFPRTQAPAVPTATRARARSPAWWPRSAAAIRTATASAAVWEWAATTVRTQAIPTRPTATATGWGTPATIALRSPIRIRRTATGTASETPAIPARTAPIPTAMAYATPSTTARSPTIPIRPTPTGMDSATRVTSVPGPAPSTPTGTDTATRPTTAPGCQTPARRTATPTASGTLATTAWDPGSTATATGSATRPTTAPGCRTLARKTVTATASGTSATIA